MLHKMCHRKAVPPAFSSRFAFAVALAGCDGGDRTELDARDAPVEDASGVECSGGGPEPEGHDSGAEVGSCEPGGDGFYAHPLQGVDLVDGKIPGFRISTVRPRTRRKSGQASQILLLPGPRFLLST
jgi:hypothetical protein